MTTSRRNASPARWAVAIFASAALNLAVVAMLMTLGLGGLVSPSSLSLAPRGQAAPSSPRPDDDKPMEIEALVDTLAEPEHKTPEEERAEEEKKKEEEDKNAKGQVVDIERPAIEARPDDSRYLAEYDSRVAHETRGAAGRDRAGARQATEGSDEVHPAVKALPSGNPAARPGLPGKRTPRADQHGSDGRRGSIEDLAPDGEQQRPGLPGAPGRPMMAPSLGEEGVPGRSGVPQPDLHPTEEMLRRAIAKGTGSPDYLGELDRGETTSLNAKKFKYATFFNRVKRAVSDEWHPDMVYVRHDPTGNVYGAKDRVTVVRVHLRPDGSLQAMNMMQSSGVDFLDEEGLEAFRKAQPFVNPPPQLVEADGLIHFNFVFILELSGKTSFRVFKYQ